MNTPFPAATPPTLSSLIPTAPAFILLASITFAAILVLAETAPVANSVGPTAPVAIRSAVIAPVAKTVLALTAPACKC